MTENIIGAQNFNFLLLSSHWSTVGRVTHCRLFINFRVDKSIYQLKWSPAVDVIRTQVLIFWTRTWPITAHIGSLELAIGSRPTRAVARPDQDQIGPDAVI